MLVLPPYAITVEDIISLLRMEDITSHFEFIMDKDSPDYLIATEHIYRDKAAWKTFKKLYKTSKIRIFFAFEAIIPDFNLFDYGISYHSQLVISDRHHRLPPPLVFFDKWLYEKYNTLNRSNMKEIIDFKAHFCNFLYSNGNAHFLRDEIFLKLSEYKFVHSLGKHLNNVKNNPTGYKGYRLESILIKKPFKFSIAAENAVFPGYTSEKILTSFQAHSIPIYFGNPDVKDLFNAKAFIDASDYSSLDKLLNKIVEIDSNEKLWHEMILEP